MRRLRTHVDRLPSGPHLVGRLGSGVRVGVWVSDSFQIFPSRMMVTGTFAPCSESSILGTFAPGGESSMKLSFPGRKFHRTFAPGNESSIDIERKFCGLLATANCRPNFLNVNYTAHHDWYGILLMETKCLKIRKSDNTVWWIRRRQQRHSVHYIQVIYVIKSNERSKVHRTQVDL